MNTTRLLSIGRSALYFNDYVISIQYFNRVIRLKPYLYEPYLLRAIAKIHLDDYFGALKDCDDAIHRNPYQAGLYYTRGYVYRQLGQYENAEADFTSALTYSPDNKTYLMLRADVRSELKKFDSALNDIDYLISRESRSGILHYERGVICLSANDTISARKAFYAATQYDSQNSSNWSALGLTNLMSDSIDEAFADLNNAISLGSKWEGDYINRALIHYKKHNYRAAIVDFDRAVNINPTNPQTYYNRAILLHELGDLNHALEDIDKALSYTDSPETFLYQRILIEMQLRQWDSALSDIDDFMGYYPNFIPIYYLAAQAYSALGDYQSAYGIRRKAKELEQKKDSIQNLQQSEDPNTDVLLASAQPKQRNRKKEFSHIETEAEIYPEKGNGPNSIRGNVQHQRAEVINEPIIILSYYSQTSNLRQTNYNHPLIEKYNKNHSLQSKLHLTIQNPILTSAIINKHFDNITTLSGCIRNYEKGEQILSATDASFLFLSRAFEFAMVQDFSSAVEDCSRAIELYPGQAIFYFCRANWRFKYSEFESFSASITQTESDIEKSIKDYDSCLHIQPDFAFASYNKANLLCIQKKYDDALYFFSLAIKYDSDFAEAYFNRGLVNIYTDRIDEGIADLSKAGELGIYQAYNLITRFR